MIDLDRIPLTDAEALIERAHKLGVSCQALRTDPVWDDEDDTGRRVLATRLLFQRHRCAARITQERQANAARSGKWWPR